MFLKFSYFRRETQAKNTEFVSAFLIFYHFRWKNLKPKLGQANRHNDFHGGQVFRFHSLTLSYFFYKYYLKFCESLSLFHELFGPGFLLLLFLSKAAMMRMAFQITLGINMISYPLELWIYLSLFILNYLLGDKKTL